MEVISEMCLDNSSFHFGIKTHQAPPPTDLVLFVVCRIPAQKLLISENKNGSENLKWQRTLKEILKRNKFGCYIRLVYALQF